MRTTPIITIIRKYGLTSKRLNPKNRIKYEDALRLVKQYENSELKIDSVIDNTRKPTHNGCHCGLPGCGQRIRYEYILKSKDAGNDTELVAGSTCVWPTLGMSELQKKEFFKLDTAIRDHYALLDWKDANKDVVDKLERLKAIKANYYKAFWEEIETAPLLDEDTEFIKGVDLAKEEEKAYYKEKFENLEKEAYNKAVAYIPELRSYYKTNTFAQSLCSAVEAGRKLTGNQFRWLKVLINRMWFDNNVKGTAYDFSNTCEDMLKAVFSNAGYVEGSANFDAIDTIEGLVSGANDKNLKMAWIAYKCKKAIVR